MKKKLLINLLILCLIILFLSGCSIKDENNKQNDITNNNQNNNSQINESNSNIENTLKFNNNSKKQTDNSSNTNNDNNNNNNNNDDDANNTNNINNYNNNFPTQSQPISQANETDLASFSTPIIDKRENRQNNIRITCSKLNGLTVEPKKIFSFCNTIGPSTSEEGYKEADVLIDGETKQALGGGNCQVSTTLYNAILASTGLTVTEHHDHGKKVPYIEKGKDATIAYNSLDLKFKNDLENTIKIYASTDGNTVTIRIVSLS